jgi:DNA-binding Lrp family transcriptional regulator
MTRLTEQEEIDDVDRSILREFSADARQSYHRIAAKLEVSVGTVRARTQRLESKGIIKGYTVLLDHEKLGFILTAVTEVTVSKGKLIETEREIASWPQVCAVYDITGLTDVLVIAKFTSREELSAFTKKILSLPNVERTNTHVVLSSPKEDFRII